MAYIGKKVEETDLTNRTVDTMVGDGSDTTLTLSATPISVNNVLVFINGIMQRPTTDYTISGTTLTFGTAPFTGGIVVAITGGGEHIGVPLAKIATDKISDGAVTNAKINSLSASKITGALPALDGSALTGISAVSNITTSASDPTISSNPANGLGTVWANTTSGEMYVLTDATAGSNVWYNVGSADGNVAKPFGGLGGGTLNGYTSGGEIGPSPAVQYNTIEKFSFTSDGNGTDHGDLTRICMHSAGASSSTDGYSMAGQGFSPTPFYNKIVDKFSFASNTTASSHGTLTLERYGITGLHSSTHAFAAGGYNNVPSHGTKTNILDKVAFASNTSGIDHGDLMAVSVYRVTNGQCSDTHGHITGGVEGAASTTIEKFAFAANTLSVDSGQDLSVANSQMSGASSTTHGYSIGGYISGSHTNKIDKFAFAASSNATDVGDLVVAVSTAPGHSSTTHGYRSAGITPSGNSAQIEKFSFSSDGNSTSVGNLPTARRYATGHHN